MSLTAGLNIARSALNAASTEAAVLARNISSVDEEGYSRRTAVSATAPGGGNNIVVVQRSTDILLQERLSQATSQAAGRQAFLDPLNQLQSELGEPGSPTSLAAQLGEFETALQLFSDSPGDDVRARLAVTAASEVARSLNTASQSVQRARTLADQNLAQSVDRINSLLREFEAVNSEITANSATGRDLNDQFDARDQILRNLSQEIGIRTINKADNGLAIFTDSGITLFERSPREVSFTPKDPLGAGEIGNPVYADGVAITGENAVLPVRSGRLQGAAEFRDGASLTIQNQLDEIARGLIETFSQSDISGSGLPAVTGLFSYPGSPAVPPSATIITGLAAEISINANVDPNRGGNPFLLRDGGIGDPGNPAYTLNTTGAPGFSGHLLEQVAGLQQTRDFDGSALAGSEGSVLSYAASSVSWLEGTRSQATSDADYHATLQARAASAFDGATGVNVDSELASLLELERSYEATARIISAIDEMLDTLFNAVR